ncbi:MAG: S8 family serine peptidase [Paramuribaculum sp.]|nr:S8 family serine peptidase [Paramuribaculum sp.]
MMLKPKKLTALAAALALAAGVSAQTKLSPGAIVRLQKYHTDAAASRGKNADAAVLATFEVASADAVDSICALGASVVDRFGDFAIVRLPLAVAEQAAAIASVRGVEFGTEARPLLDEARRYANVNQVHAGTDIKMPFTGKNVVVGIIDEGFDPLHPAFLDADGNPRSRLFYTSNIMTREISEYDDLLEFETDKKDATHGTHVAGIAAGSRSDKAIMPILSEPDAAGVVRIESVGEGKLPYYGMAPDADVAMAAGGLDYSTILAGARAIIKYAQSVGKPAVINMSLGTNSGPHDGTTTFNRALAELGKSAIFTVAAGNEGSQNISIDYVVPTATSGYFSTLLDLDGYTASEPCQVMSVDFVGLNCKSLSCTLVGVDRTTGMTVFSVPITVNSNEVDADMGSYYPFQDADKMRIRKYFSFGEGGGMIGRRADNGSYRGWVYMSDLAPLASNKSVSLGIRISSTGDAGRRMQAFTSSKYQFTSGGVKDYIDGTPDLSISDMATGDNIISVGSYNSRYMWPCLGKYFLGYSADAFPIKEPSSFSSYGELFDGRRLPHISAPGAMLVSSISRYTEPAVAERNNIPAELAAPDGVSPTGQYYQLMGTSMAAPATAGIIALWLEADPELTVDDIKDIMQKTAIKDDNYYKGNNALREGAGRIDAYAGVKEVLLRRGDTGIADVGADSEGDSGVMFDIAEGRVSAFIAGASSTTLTITTTAGASAGSVSSTGSEVSVSTGHLAPGIYIITATDGRRRASRKLAVK